MKKLWLAALCLATVAHAADVRIPGGATYQTVGRAMPWAGTGQGNLNNNYIMDVVSPSSGMCVNVQNNDTAAHTYTLTAFETSDLQLVTYTGVTGRWNPIPVSPGTAGNTAASSTDQFWINTSGAAHVVITFTGGAGVGTVDVTIAQTPSFCGGGVTTAGCSKSKGVQVATAGNAAVVSAPGAGLFIHVCAYNTSGQVTTTSALTIYTGTAGACAVPGTTLWLINAATGNSSNMLAVTAPSQLFQTDVANQPICASNGGTGGNQAVSFSYAIF
jgi:hypothetical protein